MPKAHTMVVARDPTTGAALLSATVNVYTPGTVTPIPVTIFDKNNNVLSNPLTSDPVTGLIDFYLTVPQEVDLVVAKAGYTTRTYSNVPVLDDASLDLSALLTTTGDIAYASSANTPARLAVGGTNTLLHGGATPAYSAVAYADVSAAVSTSFTPTMTQSGAVTLSVTSGGYFLLGKIAIVSMFITITSAGTSGNDIILASIPAAIAPKQAAGACLGSFIYNRNGIIFWTGSVISASASTFKFEVANNTGQMGTTPAFATANTDTLAMSLVYEVP